MTAQYILLGIVGIIVLLILGKAHRHQHNKQQVIQVDHEKCARCHSCVTKCRHQALELVSDGNKLRVELIYPDKCTGCGKCIEVCRFSALKLTTRR